MTDKYQIAIGYNQAGSLSTVNPQPNMPGLHSGRRTRGGDGIIYQDGFRSNKWHFGYMTKAQWTTFLTQAGLGEGTPSAPVTIRQPRNVTRDYTNYNAIITMPDLPDDAHYAYLVYQDIVFEISRLKEI